ncbi:MAG: protein kinase [Gemmatimonadota bacterium]
MRSCPSCGRNVTAGDDGCPACRARSSLIRALGDRVELHGEVVRGRGGFVFSGEDRQLHRRVVVEVLPQDWADGGAAWTRFQERVRPWAAMRHPSIARVYQVGRTEGHPFLVLDLDGVPLEAVLRHHGALPIPVVEAVACQVGWALIHAHQAEPGVVHGDVSLSNVFLEDRGQATLLDFGIAGFDGVETDGDGGLRTPGHPGPAGGPEGRATAASDQYGLGSVLYALAAGSPLDEPRARPVGGEDGEPEPPPPLDSIRPDCPAGLSSAVERMLARRPKDRWPDLRAALGAMGLRATAPDDPVVDEMRELVRTTREVIAGDTARPEVRQSSARPSDPTEEASLDSGPGAGEASPPVEILEVERSADESPRPAGRDAVRFLGADTVVEARRRRRRRGGAGLVAAALVLLGGWAVLTSLFGDPAPPDAVPTRPATVAARGVAPIQPASPEPREAPPGGPLAATASPSPSDEATGDSLPAPPERTPEIPTATSQETARSTTVREALRPASAVLVVRVPNAWAYISLDGDTVNPAGTSAGRPERFEILARAPHRLRLENPGMIPWDTTVALEPGDSLVIDQGLQPLIRP